MKIKQRNTLELPLFVVEEIAHIIESSLNNITTVNEQFIVNDTIWYAKKRKGGVSPCVVNEAGFISKKFQSNLAEFQNWNGEIEIANQDIDGYGKLTYDDSAYIGYTIKEEFFLKFLNEYIKIQNLPEFLISKFFAIFYGMYIKRDIFTLDYIPEDLHKYFVQSKRKGDKCIRIGVEFETGNTSSAYRAFFKLNSLFAKGFIDIGIFITSSDKKNCAARIWPQSNRNGSFEELEQRNYKDNIFMPMLEFEFEPDAFSSDVAYLKENGTLYTPISKVKTIKIGNEMYEIFLGSNEDEIMKKVII